MNIEELEVLDKIAYSICHKYKGVGEFQLDELHSTAMELLMRLKKKNSDKNKNEFRGLFACALHRTFINKINKMKAEITTTGDIELISDLNQSMQKSWFDKFKEFLSYEDMQLIYDVLEECNNVMSLRKYLVNHGYTHRGANQYIHEIRKIINAI